MILPWIVAAALAAGLAVVLFYSGVVLQQTRRLQRVIRRARDQLEPAARALIVEAREVSLRLAALREPPR